VGGGGKGKKDGGVKGGTTVTTGRGAIGDVDAEKEATGMERMQHRPLAANPSFRLVQENDNVPKEMEEEEEEEEEEQQQQQQQ
jgi:hypothetical protein